MQAGLPEALISEKNLWIHRNLEGLNTKDSIEFWKRYKKQFCKMPENSVGHLIKPDNSGLTQNDAEKEEILFSTFLKCSHLENKDFDDEWLKTMEEHVSQLEENNWDIDEDEEGDPDLEDMLEENDDNLYLNSEIQYDDVLAAISAQKTAGKCSDMDKFHPLLLKKLPREAIKFLALLFNKVMAKGKWIWNS